MQDMFPQSPSASSQKPKKAFTGTIDKEVIVQRYRVFEDKWRSELQRLESATRTSADPANRANAEAFARKYNELAAELTKSKDDIDTYIDMLNGSRQGKTSAFLLKQRFQAKQEEMQNTIKMKIEEFRRAKEKKEHLEKLQEMLTELESMQKQILTKLSTALFEESKLQESHTAQAQFYLIGKDGKLNQTSASVEKIRDEIMSGKKTIDNAKVINGLKVKCSDDGTRFSITMDPTKLAKCENAFQTAKELLRHVPPERREFVFPKADVQNSSGYVFNKKEREKIIPSNAFEIAKLATAVEPATLLFQGTQNTLDILYQQCFDPATKELRSQPSFSPTSGKTAITFEDMQMLKAVHDNYMNFKKDGIIFTPEQTAELERLNDTATKAIQAYRDLSKEFQKKDSVYFRNTSIEDKHKIQGLLEASASPKGFYFKKREEQQQAISTQAEIGQPPAPGSS